MNTIYIGIGSNLDSPLQQVQTAIAELNQLGGINAFVVSSLYRSSPMTLTGRPEDQPDYINAVAGFESSLSPHQLLDELQAIESQHGRVRTGEQWGPRTLDLDLLLYGEQIIDDSRLKVPHPGLDQRSFVLYPLSEIAPDLLIPAFGPITDLIHRLPDGGILERISTA